jgi:hypothetical protein
MDRREVLKAARSDPIRINETRIKQMVQSQKCIALMERKRIPRHRSVVHANHIKARSVVANATSASTAEEV